MSTRLTAAKIKRFRSFLAEALNREAQGTPPLDVRMIQEQFWTTMSAHLRVNDMSTVLQHLDQLARDTMDVRPGAALQGTVLALPVPPAAATSGLAADPVIVPAEAAKGKTPACPKRIAVASGKASAKKSRVAPKSKTTKTSPPKATTKASDAESKPPASPTHSSQATPLADAFGVSPKAPDVFRQAIEVVLSKARALGKSPCRLAFPWNGRPLWYDPVAHPDVHRAHWRFWMTHRRAFWDWAFHAPLESGNPMDNRRKIKLRAVQSRLVFLSFCIETWGFFGCMERLDEHPELFWLGGPPGRTSGDTTQPSAPFAKRPSLASGTQRQPLRGDARERAGARLHRLLRATRK